MALPKWRIDISVRDGENKVSTMTAYHNALLHADARTAASQLAGFVSVLTEGVVSKVELTEVVDTSAAAAPSGSDVEIKALFTFDNDDTKAAQMSIPAFMRSYMLPNSDRVNVANPDVADFTGHILGSGFVDSRNVALVGLRSAVEQFTRRRVR